MKKTKMQLLHRIFAMLGIAVLVLQVALPAVTVFAESVDPSVESSALQVEEKAEDTVVPSISDNSVPTEQSNTSKNEGPSAPVQPADNGRESSDAPAASAEENKQRSEDEGEGDEDSDPEPVVETETQETDSTEGTTVKSEEKVGLFNVGLQSDLGNIFIFDYLRIDGVDVNDGDFISIDADTRAELGFEWNTEGLNAQAGDTATLRLSDAFTQVNITTPRQILVDGTHVGDYTVTDGVVQFVFNENITQDNVQNGYLELDLYFNLEKFREDRRQEIPFEHSEDQNITITARPNLNHSGITKEGHPDSQHDAREITWSIDVINTNDEPITAAQLLDSLPDGLGDARDFVVRSLTVDFDGNSIAGEVAPISADGFPVELGTIAPFEGYRIEYKTTIEDYSKTSFTNDAIFKYGDTELPADATVGGLTRSNPIEKSGSRIGNEDAIRWTIDVNKNGSLINEAIVEDSLPQGVSIVPGTIRVVRLTQQGNSWVEGDPHESTFSEFPIELGQLGQEDAYRIIFDTEIDWSEVNGGEYQENNGFQNVATLYDDENELNADEATVSWNRAPILEKVETGNVDYENRTITWKVTVNRANHPLENIIVSDTLPAGLSLTAANVRVLGADGQPYDDASVNVNGQVLTVELENIGTEQITIEYTTTIDSDSMGIDEFTNTVGMEGIGVGEGGNDREVTIEPNGNTYQKNYMGINYQEKTIDWELKVNPVREDINAGFVITDTFTNDGLILDPTSMEIRLGEEVLDAGSDYILAPIDEHYQNGFTITFNIPIAKAELVVTFTTSYDPDLEILEHSGEDEEGLYRNHALFEGETENGNSIEAEDDASQRVRDDSWNSGKKEGRLVSEDAEGAQVNGWISGNERKVAWEFYFNYQQQDLGTGVIVTDELQYEGEIDEVSVKVYPYTVDAAGETTIDFDNPLNTDNYSLVVNGKELTLTFNADFVVDERYVITFNTSVPNRSADTYTNEAAVTVGDNSWPYTGTVNYNEYNSFLNKSAVGTNGNQVYTGDEVNWEARVNDSLSILENAVVTDTISAGHVYLNETLKVVKLEAGEEIELVEDEDYTLEVNVLESGQTELVISLKDTLENTLVLYYTTVVTETDGEIGNEISLKGADVVIDEIESEKLTAEEFSRVGGEWSRSTRGVLKVTKVDTETEETIANNEATFTLWYYLNDDLVQFGTEEYETVNGVLEIVNLPLRTYYLREVKSPNGYVLSEEDLEIVVDTPFGTEGVYTEGTFENTKEKTEITGTKVYENGPQPSIELQLFRDGQEFEDPVELDGSEDEPWTYTWTNLDRTDSEGNAYRYTIDEVEVPENYEKTISEDGLTVTNTFGSPLIDIPVEKTWEDAENQDGVRPESIEVELLANGEGTEFDNLILAVDNDWQGTFTELPELDSNGDVITYAVQEVNVPEGYEVEITGDANAGFVITNQHTPSKISIPVQKVWNDANNQDGIRPEFVTVRLFANGDEIDFRVLSLLNNWQTAFSDLDEYQNGELIEYEVIEDEVSGYTSEVTENSEGLIFTNTHEPELIDLAGTKTWDDVDNQDGKRPEVITVRLLANGTEVAKEEVTAAEDDTWNYSFDNLPKFKNGEAIHYTITEDSVQDYSTVVNGMNITNSYTPGKTSVNVVKVWNDNYDQDGIRPEYVRVQLLANDEATEKIIVLNAGNNWQGAFTDLDEYQNGELIEYTIQEVIEEDSVYEAVVAGSHQTGFIIENNYTPETIDISGTKFWHDDNNRDGKRPESITVYLLANNERVRDNEGKFIGQEVRANEAGDWNFNFDNLPKYENGQMINYSVEEVKVTDYQQGYEDDGTVTEIHNSYTPGLTSVGVRKVWNDSDNQDGIRPDSITVRLLADGEVVDEQEVTSEMGWRYIFTDLDEYKEGDVGQLINYTVEEISVEGYETIVTPADSEEEVANNYVITNIHEPELIELSGTKTWDDADDQDGKRPDSITIRLLANGEEVKSAKVTSETEWTYSFTDLPKFAEGAEIIYTIQEDVVSEYSTEIDGFDVTNSYTPGQTSVNVVKHWQDANNREGIRPDEITIKLLADGKETGEELKLTAEMNWQGSFQELVEYKDGTVIVYTVEEVAVEGYETSYSGDDQKGFVITNTHKSEKVSKPSKPKKHGKLPQTGENQGIAMMVLGLVVISLTAAGYIIYNRKQKQ